MEEQCEINGLRNPRPVKLPVAVEAGLVEADNGRLHDAFPYLVYGRDGLLPGLVDPVHKRALADFQTEHLLEEVLYTAIRQEHHHAQVDDQRLDGSVIDNGVGAALAGTISRSYSFSLLGRDE